MMAKDELNKFDEGMGDSAIKQDTLFFQYYSAQNTTNVQEYLPVRAHGKYVCKAIVVMVETLIYLVFDIDQTLDEEFCI